MGQHDAEFHGRDQRAGTAGHSWETRATRHGGRPGVSADEIAARARHLLADDAVRAATARLAAEVAEMPAPAEVVERLSQLTPSP
ncbi:hypothetical protein GCM10023321_19960 [Pseudonocardia eucalypti]|uniref:Uncharacterized protein n=1 Tax=Pseudonocardia eucalypti TaxID=648755 RepID=A0ABP9PTS4_9PSEU|nr:UDP:flavonoid glycosyltransferase YjiC (YdhE family) [Pseudonocardia eucalypti]